MAIYEERESYAASRAGGIGGTDCAAILGLSPYKAPIDVYAAKVDPESQPELDKECLTWGTLLEPIVRERYAQKFEVEVVAPSQLWHKHFPKSKLWNDSTIVIGREDWMLGAPDGWMPKVRNGLEVKCSSRKSHDWGSDGSDEVPAHYLVQAAWYMAVCDAPAWNFAVLFSGNTLAQYRVVRDMDLEISMIEVCRSFWHDNVLKQVEPPIDQTESYGRYLARKFSLSTGAVIKNPSPELNAAAIMFKEAQDRVKDAEETAQLRKNQLAALLADADAAQTSSGKVQWVRPSPRKSVDWNTITAALQIKREIIEAHTKETPVTPYVRGYWAK
jgi:putative phage-type endonuclease